MTEILLATRNAGKLHELQRLTAAQPWRWRTLDDFPNVPDAIESGATFAENAALKARHYATATGLLTLADDSGLEVDALGGAPGVRSARYAGEPKDDDANNRKLVLELQKAGPAARAARFCCALALAERDQLLATTTGTVVGVIIETPRGSNGFGYDPHFYLPHFDRTMAELDPSTKNRISHRGQALRAMLEQLAKLLAAR